VTPERKAECYRIVSERFAAGEYDYVSRDLLDALDEALAVQVSIAEAMGREPSDGSDLVEAVRRLVRERGEALEDATLWRQEQAEIDADQSAVDDWLAENARIRAMPEAERTAAVADAVARGVFEDESDPSRYVDIENHTKQIAAAMPAFVRALTAEKEQRRRAEKAERERDEARQAAETWERNETQALVDGARMQERAERAEAALRDTCVRVADAVRFAVILRGAAPPSDEDLAAIVDNVLRGQRGTTTTRGGGQ